MKRTILAALGLLAALCIGAAVPAAAQCTFCGYPEVGSDDINGDFTVPSDTNLDDGTANITVNIPIGVLGGAGLVAEPIYSVIPIGSVAYASLGTNTTPVAGTQYFAEIAIPVNFTVSAIACLNGSAAATDLLIYGLWSPDGEVLGNTALAGVVASGTNAFQSISLTAPLDVTAGHYYVGYQTNGTTTRLRTIAASTYLGVLTDSETGSFGTLEEMEFAGTFTADVGPICYVSGSPQ